MKKILLLLSFLGITIMLDAQIEGCDGTRYIDDVFQDVSIFPNVKFGEGETVSGEFQELFLDVYEPTNDLVTQRPAIILAFGGSYIGGERGDLQDLCEAYARKGYVAVAIDYRLYDGPLLPVPNAAQMKEVVIKTVSDMKAAIRFMREDADNANLYRIDPNFIVVGGVSAGSITAMHTAVLDDSDDLPNDIRQIIEENGGLEGNSSDNFEYSSEVQAIINFSGGLNEAIWIDANDPPLISIHDDMDPVVPFGSGFATIFDIPIIAMEGSRSCHDRADTIGVLNQIRVIENSDGHVSYFLDPFEFVSSINFTAELVADLMCSSTSTAELNEDLARVSVYPNPSNGLLTIEGEGIAKHRVEIHDIYGRLVAKVQNPTSTIDMTDLNNGIYFLNIMDEQSHNHKTIKVVLEK